MPGLVAVAPNFWSYGCIAIGILAAIAIEKKPCRWPFAKNPREESARPPVIRK
jgi:hypothetical protein